MYIFKKILLIILSLWTLGMSLQVVNYRLPTNSIPERYELKFDPNLEDFTFTGEIKINLVVLQQSSNITLHAKNLSIIENKTELRSYSTSGPLYTIEKHEYNETTDFLILKSTRTLQVGLYVLILFFSGTLNDKNIGFYRSSYQDSKNKTVWIATTQFESTNARYAFPCYDQPALKSEFQVILKRYPNQYALSNAVMISEKVDSSDRKIWCTFDWTPRMSTYLLAFVIADYRYITSADNRSRVWTKPDSINHTYYALRVGETALENLSRYVNISYYQTLLPKMDQISVSDFRAGAMENLGAVIYRERLLLFQDGVTSDIDKQSITTVIYHEFAHQWFGNLVSPSWWKYVWLNEGFATYFEYFGTAMMAPDWRLNEQFVVKEMHFKAFSFDVTNASHPINANVESPKEIRSIFDSISYAKAACIIRMLCHIVTEKVFRTGLTNYLRNNQFGSAEPKNLWKGIQEAVDSAGINYNISEIMDPWINQVGIPLIRVERNYTSNTVKFSQEIFNTTYENKSAPGNWWVPLNGVSSKNLGFNITAATDWISGRPNKTVTDLGASLDEWIIINNQQTGYYRVMYDLTNWKRLISYLNTGNYTKIHRVNRAQLINDGLNLAKSGYLNYTMALELIEYLKQETDYIPWYSAFSEINYIDKMMVHAASYENFRKYIRNLMSVSKKTVGFKERSTDDQTTILQRSNVLKYLCYFGDSECNKNAFTAVQKWTLGGAQSTVPRNLKHVYYCASIQSSGNVHWIRMWNKYLSSTVSSDKILLLSALGCTENKAVLQRFIQLATTPNSGIRYQDSLTAILAVFTNIPKNIDVVLDYMMENFTDFVKYYSDNSALSTILTGLSQRITTKKQLEKLLNLTRHHGNLIDLTTDVAKSAKENLIWIEKYQSIILNWCTDKIKESDTPKTINKPSTASCNKKFSSIVFISFLSLIMT